MVRWDGQADSVAGGYVVCLELILSSYWNQQTVRA